MAEQSVPSPPPLVLVANDQEWSARSLESVLAPDGYAVLRAYDGEEALERALSARPDIIVIDMGLPDPSGLEVCRTLCEDERITASTPIVLINTNHLSRERRLAAYKAGAWDFLQLPLDTEELLLKFGTFMKAKRDADDAREESLLDQITGLYNMRGLLRRANELGAYASRYNTPLACVVFAPEPQADDAGDTEMGGDDDRVGEFARLFKAAARRGDAVGRLGRDQFAVIAPATDDSGAVKLAQRFIRALEEAGAAREPQPTRAVRMRAGYYASPDFGNAAIDPPDLLVRATMALRNVRPDADEPIYFYDAGGESTVH